MDASGSVYLPCLLLLVGCSKSAVSGESIGERGAICIKDKSICIPQNFSKYDLPSESLTIVSLGVDIIDIPKIDDKEFIISLNAYLSVQWIEPRLIIDKERFKSVLGDRPWFSVEKSFFNELWLPDLLILNLNNLETKAVFAKLENQWLTDKFELGYKIATRISFICSMSFENFPLDVQVCLFKVSKILFSYIRR